jgi:hypothetical protein
MPYRTERKISSERLDALFLGMIVPRRTLARIVATPVPKRTIRVALHRPTIGHARFA